MKKNKQYLGFSLAETIVSISVILILFMIAIPAYRQFSIKADVDQGREIIISALRQAQKRTIASRSEGNWGVYFATSTSPNQAIIFFGASYASRSTSHDEPVNLPSATRINSIIPYDMREVVFERITGIASSSAVYQVELISDEAKNASVYLSASGQISTNAFVPPDDEDRFIDTRHLHFTYSGTVATSTASIVLTFNNGTLVETIPINNFLTNDQFYWDETVSVGGQNQSLIIKTMRLNSPDTLFCLVRDRRHNNMKLDIDLDSDLSVTPNLLEISADGLSAATGTSLFVSGPIWQ